MHAAFRIGGRLTLELRGLAAREQAAIARQLDPAPPAPGTDGDLVIECDGTSAAARLVDLQRNAGDGRLTGSDGRVFYLLEGGRACTVPAPGAPLPVHFAVEPGFPTGRAFGRLVRPALQLALLQCDAAAAHAAAVEVDGRALLLAGWSESGKTETALAFMEDGARFLSDKWTVVGGDGTAAVFPIGVGVRGWVLRFLPQLRAALGGRLRGRLGAAATARTLARPLLRGALGDPLERAITLADRIAIAPSRLRALYGDDPGAPWHAPLGAVALLTTVPTGTPVGAQPASAEWAAARLARTADFERRRTFELHDRACWSLPSRDPGARARLANVERALLERVLATVTVIDVRAPFPTDPRSVAAAIARLL